MKGRQLRLFLVERDGPHCHWCGRLSVDPLEVGDTADAAATVDHLDVPRLRRSVRDPARGVVACSRCNHDRGCLTVEEWRAVLEVRAMRTRSFCDANRCGVELKPVPTPYSQVGVSGPRLALSEVRQRLQKPKAFVHGAVITDQLHTYGVPHLSAVVLDVEEVPRHRSSEPSHTSLVRKEVRATLTMVSERAGQSGGHSPLLGTGKGCGHLSQSSGNSWLKGRMSTKRQLASSCRRQRKWPRHLPLTGHVPRPPEPEVPTGSEAIMPKDREFASGTIMVSSLSASEPNIYAAGLHLASVTIDGDLVSGSGFRLSDPHPNRAMTGRKSTFSGEDLRQKDRIAHCVSEIVLIYAEIVYDSAPSVVDVVEEAGHRRLRLAARSKWPRRDRSEEPTPRPPRPEVRAGPSPRVAGIRRYAKRPWKS